LAIRVVCEEWGASGWRGMIEGYERELGLDGLFCICLKIARWEVRKRKVDIGLVNAEMGIVSRRCRKIPFASCL
jgi:hypothetical protein